jgi:FixJ family two-component response regulator
MRCVWVIDDVQAVADSVVTLLKAEGIAASPFADAKEVLVRLAAGERPAVMILDMSMPNEGGRAILTAVATDPSMTFPILVYTGWGDDVVDGPYRGRVREVLPKNGEPLALVSAVREAIGWI